MKKYDKEIDQLLLDNEKAVLKQLEANYTDALEEINSRIAELMGRADADMQHVVYQIEYQKALKAQTEAILKTLQNNKFETVSAYLTKCYDDGFISTLYAIQKQGVPLVFPINQEEVASAIQLETNLSTSLYEAFDMKDLQKKIAGEISRGFSTGALYSEITRNVASYAMIDKNKAMRIVRTEGHRITETAASNAQKRAKDRGADIVKIWDATLDGKTRPSHMRVDGEIREIGKKFSNGLEFPGDPSGKAAEVINCRCRSRSDARWALEADETKMLGDVSKMSEERKKEIAKKLGVPVDTLDQYSEQIVPVRAKNYADFKRQYDQLWRYEGSALQKEAEERIASYGKKTVANTGKSSTIDARNMSNVSTGGKRNEEPLSEAQISEAKAAAIKQGYDGSIIYSQHSYTSFHGSTEGDPFHYLIIGTDAFPNPNNSGIANEMVSLNGCMAHEIVGHYEAWKKGTMQSVDVLEEAQASIRASRFGKGLTNEERRILMQDAMDRLDKAGISFEDVEDDLDIWER